MRLTNRGNSFSDWPPFISATVAARKERVKGARGFPFFPFRVDYVVSMISGLAFGAGNCKSFDFRGFEGNIELIEGTGCKRFVNNILVCKSICIIM